MVASGCKQQQPVQNILVLLLLLPDNYTCRQCLNMLCVMQSILFTKHAFLVSMLRLCISEGIFNAMDGIVTFFELLWYGKKSCKRCKKQLRRQAKKFSCLAQSLLQFVPPMQSIITLFVFWAKSHF